MTSTAGTDEHPEVSEISAFTEGILSPDRSAELRGHLAHCMLCTDVRNSLDEIRGLLGTLPGPARMPEDVASRIDAALAAEALIAASAPGNAGPQPTEPAPRMSRPDDARVSRETSPSSSRPSGRAGAATGPGRASRRGRRRWTLVAATCSVAVLGLGGILVHSMGTSGHGNASAAGSRQSAVGSFSGVQLPTRVHQLLASTGSPKPSTAGPQAGKNTPFLANVPSVPHCVLKATGQSSQPIAASKGTYKGHSSYLVVLPHPSDPQRVDAYVVDSSCASASPGSSGSSVPVKLGKVLVQQTFDRS